MNRWTHPIQWAQQTMDRHQSYIVELQKTVSKLKDEIERLERDKADRKGRKTKITVVK